MKKTLYAGIVLLILAASCRCSGGGSVVLLPEVAAFLEEHTEFGRAVASETVPDWAKGKRQRVRFDSGRSLLFYTKDNAVITVCEDQAGVGRVKVWGEYYQAVDPTPVARESEAGLPAYTILFANEKLSGGGRFGDALVPSLSRATPVAERERVTRQIAAKEKINELSVYSSEKAYKANVSASYAASNPDAMHQGFLGVLQDGKFTPGEALYP
jgi:hypothetical protein